MNHIANINPTFAEISQLSEKYHILSHFVENEVGNFFDNCRLCWAISKLGQRFPSNLILYEFDEYVVIPALGSFMPGYLLFLSKKHKSSLATLSDKDISQIEKHLNNFMEKISDISSKWIIFEHGSTKRSGIRSCCIDHFHFHILPLDIDLASDISERMDTQKIALNKLCEINIKCNLDTRNYILIRNPDKQFYVLSPDAYSSQYVRQVISAYLNQADKWNWKNHARDEISINTISIFKDKHKYPRMIYYTHAIEKREKNEVHKNIERAINLLSKNELHASIFSMFKLLGSEFYENYLNEKDFDRLLVETEVRFLKACDFMLVDLSIEGWQYVGSLMEIAYANIIGIPVITVVGNASIRSRRWLKAHVHKIVKTYEEAFKELNILIYGQDLKESGAL